jgi:hypothetical protein
VGYALQIFDSRLIIENLPIWDAEVVEAVVHLEAAKAREAVQVAVVTA